MEGEARRAGGDWLLPVVVPLALIVVILGADALEGPKTAYVGVLTAVPILAAVFGTPRQTAAVAVVTWLAALGFGLLASDGNVAAQRVRLGIIALAGVAAVMAARGRRTREDELALARREARTAGRLADLDPLTGMLNRRGMLAALDRPREEDWTLALLDVDLFKEVNDRFGHLAGDECLDVVARRLTRSLAEVDLVGRWGGDEFLIALPLPWPLAGPVLARVHRSASLDPVATTVGPVEVTVTIGATPWEPGESLDEALRRADLALYRGKAAGRDRVLLDPEPGLEA